MTSPDTSESPSTGTTSPPLFSLPEYELAGWRFFHKTVNALMRSKDPLLRQFEMVEVEELPASRVSLNEASVDVPPFPVRSLFTVQIDDAIRGEFDSLYIALDDAAHSALASLMPQFFSSLTEVMEATGQTVDATETGFTPEKLIEVLDKVEWSFNDDGTPNLPTLVMSPQAHAKTLEIWEREWTKEHDAQLAALTERKREAYFARRRNRRLS